MRAISLRPLRSILILASIALIASCGVNEAQQEETETSVKVPVASAPGNSADAQGQYGIDSEDALPSLCKTDLWKGTGPIDKRESDSSCQAELDESEFGDLAEEHADKCDLLSGELALVLDEKVGSLCFYRYRCCRGVQGSSH